MPRGDEDSDFMDSWSYRMKQLVDALPLKHRGIFDLSELHYSNESYATWAYGVPFTDYDRALLAEMNINLETK